jgi:broad specificity phosphatase PhoE
MYLKSFRSSTIYEEIFRKSPYPMPLAKHGHFFEISTDKANGLEIPAILPIYRRSRLPKPWYNRQMKTVYFARHGQSLANAGGPTMPPKAIPLTELGHAQAKELASRIAQAPPLLCASSMLRAQQTATPLSSRHLLRVRIDSTFDEFQAIGYELVEGTTAAERRAIADAYWTRADPNERAGAGAETFLEFQARVELGMKIASEMPHGAIVYGHGQWISLAACAAAMRAGLHPSTGNPIHDFNAFHRSFHIDNCSLHAFDFEGEAWSHRHAEATPTPDAGFIVPLSAL